MASDDNVNVSRDELRQMGFSEEQIDELAGEASGGQQQQGGDQQPSQQQPTGKDPWQEARELSEQRQDEGATREDGMSAAIGHALASNDPRTFVDHEEAFDQSEVQGG